MSAYGSVGEQPRHLWIRRRGTPERDYLLIDRGILVNCLTSRAMISEDNHVAGAGCSTAAAAPADPPPSTGSIDRMTNVNMLPGRDGTLEDIVAGTETRHHGQSPSGPREQQGALPFRVRDRLGGQGGRITRVLKNPLPGAHPGVLRQAERRGRTDNLGGGTGPQLRQGRAEPGDGDRPRGSVMRFDDVITGEER